jgi:phenylacetate-CoA ligase
VCGRGFELLESIEGRATDVVMTPSGNRLIVHFFTGILELFDEIDSFQVVQDEISSLTLRVKPGRDYSPSAIQRAVAMLQERGASDLDIRVELVDEIPLSAGGKCRFVVSTVGREPSRRA